MKFFRLFSEDQTPGSVVVVAEDTAGDMLLIFVPNTGKWHRAAELENDYLFGDEGGRYEPITADQAGSLLHRVLPFDKRRSVDQRLLARYEAQPPSEQRTNAEMGLTQKQTNMKPMSAPGIKELLRRSSKNGQRRTVALYPPGTRTSAPRQFVSEWSRHGKLGNGEKLVFKTVETKAAIEIKALIGREKANETKTAKQLPPRGSGKAKAKAASKVVKGRTQ